MSGEKAPGTRVDWVLPMRPYNIPEQIVVAMSRSGGEASEVTHQNSADASAPSTKDQIARLGLILPTTSNTETHAKFWHTLLYAEEVQSMADMEDFGLHRCRLTRVGHLFRLSVPGLAERRPSILVGDKIRLHPSNDESITFVGYVHRVDTSEVFLSLHKRFRADDFYNIEFIASRSSFRRMHQVLDMHTLPSQILYPEASDVDKSHLHPLNVGSIVPLDSRLRENDRQIQAVSSILNPGASIPFIVFGPPGTGKTMVIIESIRQILATDPSARILACAPSNFAADEIAQRLASFGVDSKTLFRLNAYSRPVSQLPADLRRYSSASPDSTHFLLPSVEEIKSFRVVVSTCLSATLLFATGVPRGWYSTIFVDEAGHALEPEALVPILGLATDSTRVVLCGDPLQLGPIVRSKNATHFGFGVSLLERLMKRAVYSSSEGSMHQTKLLQNYRSHPAILEFPNRTWYDSELLAKGPDDIVSKFCGRDALQIDDFPVLCYPVQGEDMKMKTSYYNEKELEEVDRCLKMLLDNAELDIAPSDIGIISPYIAQTRMLRCLDLVQRHKSIKIGSAEAFQGQERPIVILSTVRSNPRHLEFDIVHALGFVANPRRLNVAITRARSLLIVIGDPAVLSREHIWNQFLHYIRDGGGWRGPEYPLPSLENHENQEGSSVTSPAAFHDSLVVGKDGDGSDFPIREDE